MIIKSIRSFDGNSLLSFACGNKDLDHYFKKHALENDLSGYGKTYVLEDGGDVIGYFTLCSSSIKFEEYPKKLRHGLPKYPIPSVRIARLAVAKQKQGLGYGKEMLKQALLKILFASTSVGIRLIVVDAKETSASFYEKFGFQKLLDDKLTYFLSIDTLNEAMK